MTPNLKWIITRTFTLYAILFCVSFAIVDYNALRIRIMVRTLNHNLPPNGFRYLVRLGEGEKDVPVDKEALRSYTNYYERVIKYMPHLADAHGMLGISYFYLDQPGKAIREFEKAGVLNPHFFFFQYNLGVLNFLKGDYAKAATFFESARGKSVEFALLFIKNGTEYQRALFGITNLGDLIMLKMKSAYTECYRLLVVSHLKLKNYEKARNFCQEAIDLGLGAPETFYYYGGVASYQLQQFDRSILYLQEAIKIDPDYAEVYQYMSYNLKALGSDMLSDAAFTKSMELLQQQKVKRPKENEAHLRII